MSSEVSLSLEETNKIRIQLGLKPIEARATAATKEDKPARKQKEEQQPHHDVQFIDENRANLLRKRLFKISQVNNSDRDTSKQVNSGWLDEIRSQNDGNSNQRVKISYDNERDEYDDMPVMKLSHNLGDLKAGKDIVLTLKEKGINDGDESGDEDILEDEGLATFKSVSKNLKLKGMDKDRRRKKYDLEVSSKNIEDEMNESEKEESVLVIGAKTNISDEIGEEELSTNNVGKMKVTFDNSGDEEDEDAGDFRVTKIKKRKRKDSIAVKTLKRVKWPTEVKKIDLIDEDEGEDENEAFENSISSSLAIRRNVPDINVAKSAIEIADEIRREAIENKRREMDIQKMHINRANLIVDENTSFLNTLDSKLITPEEDEKDDLFQVEDNLLSDNKLSEGIYVESSKTPSVSNESVNFSTGLASTLQFLQEHNVLPKKDEIIEVKNTDKEDLLKLKQKIEFRKLQHKYEDGEQNKKDSTMKNGNIHIDKEREIQNRASAIQSEFLKDYNPEVNLVYKDEKGNELTTKEAYKKLSQRFHGTKSNKKKQAKFDARIKQRKRQQEATLRSNMFSTQD